jgi:hypothetical protein
MQNIANKIIANTPEIRNEAISDIESAFSNIPKAKIEPFWRAIERTAHAKAHNGFLKHIHNCLQHAPKVSRQGVKTRLLKEYCAIEVELDRPFLLGVDQIDDFIKLIKEHHE